MEVSRAEILQGLNWNYLGAISRAGLQLGISAVLARLLNPSDFGLMAIGFLIIQLGKYFSETGIGGALVQGKTIDDDHIGASFWLSTLFGVLCFVILVLLAHYVASFFKTAEVLPVIRYMSLGFIFSGMSITSISLMRRSLDFKSLVIIENASYFIGYGIFGMALAYFGFGVYSLVVAFLVQTLITCCLAYVKTRHSFRLPRQRDCYYKLMNYGGKYSWHTFLCFVGSYLDHIMIGRYFNNYSLGIYNRGKALTHISTYPILASLSAVLFPSYARSQDDKERLKSLFLNSFLIVGVILFSVSFGLIPAADAAVRVLLGNQWLGSIQIMQVWCIFMPVSLVTSIAATLCSATDRIKRQMVIESAFSLIAASTILLIKDRQSLLLIANVIGACYFLRFFAYLFFVKSILSVKWKEIIKIIFCQFVFSLTVFTAVYVVTKLLHGLPSFILLSFQIITGGITFVTLVLFSPFTDIRHIFYKVLKNYEPQFNRSVLYKTLMHRLVSGELPVEPIS